MGTRPSAEDMVNDPEDVDACIVDELGEYEYRAGAATAGGLDWGFSGMTAWAVGMAYKDNVVPILKNRQWSQVRSGVIFPEIRVKNQSGKHSIYDQGAFRAEDRAERAPQIEAPSGHYCFKGKPASAALNDCKGSKLGTT